VGIAEQNLVTVAAGLALSGKRVFIYAIIPFITSRCFEMLKVDLSLMNLPVAAVGVGAGFSYDDSGPTHHATEDIALMRILPNMTIFSPSDSVLAASCAQLALNTPGPCYVRLDRQVMPRIYSAKDDFLLGFRVLRDGGDIGIVATGNMVHRALEVAARLKAHSIDAMVIDLYRIKPVTTHPFLTALKNLRGVITLEEHLIAGGIGSLAGEIILGENAGIPLKCIGIEDRYYYAYGGRDHIQSLCGLDVSSITERIRLWSKSIE
jgi:transketolase